VGLDPTYAPAWDALGQRYSYDAAYSTGGEAAHQRSNAALERALTLDPNLISAAGWLIDNRVERGELISAYTAAKDLVARHPENAFAHFTLAYVARYGGAIEESAHECNAALALDPGNYQFRSCSMTFDQLGNYKRAVDFLQLDAGSVWASSNLIRHYVREGKIAQAREVAQNVGVSQLTGMLVACLNDPSSPDTASVIRRDADRWGADPDPEVRYTLAGDFLFCGHRDIALKMLQSSIITGHFCAYEGLKNDSAYAPLRGTPEFSQLLSAAKQCQSDFLSQTSRTAH
jgi:hypothetical protein